MPKLPDLVKCPSCGCWITLDLAARVDDEERPEKCPGRITYISTSKENN